MKIYRKCKGKKLKSIITNIIVLGLQFDENIIKNATPYQKKEEKKVVLTKKLPKFTHANQQ